MGIAIGFGLMHIYWGYVTSLVSNSLRRRAERALAPCRCSAYARRADLAMLVHVCSPKTGHRGRHDAADHVGESRRRRRRRRTRTAPPARGCEPTQRTHTSLKMRGQKGGLTGVF